MVQIVYEYIGMLIGTCQSPEGLPPHIFDELKSIADLSYEYQNEQEPGEFVEDFAEELSPVLTVPPEFLLNGQSLVFSFDQADVLHLLTAYFVPENARIDMLSSAFGRASDYEDDGDMADGDGGEDSSFSDEEEANEGVPVPQKLCGCLRKHSKNKKCPELGKNLFLPPPPPSKSESDLTPPFDPQSEIEKANILIEPHFKTRYWRHKLSTKTINVFNDALKRKTPSSLHIPNKNPFIPTMLKMKPLPANDALHPLVNASIKVANVAKKSKNKNFYPAVITQFDSIKNELVLSFEDEEKQVSERNKRALFCEMAADGYIHN